MKKSDLASYALFLLTAVAGASLGQWHNNVLQNSDLVSTEASSTAPTLNDYNNLPCPDDATYERLQARLHLTLPDNTKGCSTKITAGFGKILLLMDQTRLQTPANWFPVLQAELSQPFEYLVSHVDKMYFNLAETDALASNIGDRTIVLGGGLLMNNPFDAMSTLIHEARHSEGKAVKHVECIGGDLPRTRGGCDAKFAVDENAGAYAYDVIFQSSLALFGVGLSDADREYLTSSALAILGTRFNELPATLSTHADMLVTLDKNHKVQLVHPFTKDFIPLNISFKDPSEHVVRLDFSVRDSGVLVFTNKKHLYSWTPRRGLGPLYKKLFDNVPVHEAARITLPTEEGRSRFVAQTADGKMYWVKFNPEKLDWALAPFPYLEIDPGKINKAAWKRFFLASYGESVFLSQNGKVYLGGHKTKDSKTFQLREDMQDPSGWVSGTGGLSYDSIYLINGRGEAKVASTTLQEIDDYHSITTYTFSNIDFQIPHSIKYLQGLQTQVQLSKNGDLYLQGYAAKDVQAIEHREIKDFAFAQIATLDESIAPAPERSGDFNKVCNIEKRIRDPWFGKGIGIDNQQRLVFAGTTARPCLIRENLPAVVDVELKPDPDNRGTGLMLKTAGGTMWLAPYGP